MPFTPCCSTDMLVKPTAFGRAGSTAAPFLQHQMYTAAQQLDSLSFINSSLGAGRHTAGAMLILPATGSPGVKACGRSQRNYQRMVRHNSDVLIHRQLRKIAAEAPDGHGREPALAQSAPAGAKLGDPVMPGRSDRPAGGAAQGLGSPDGRDDGSAGSADNSPAVSAPDWPPVRPGGAAASTDSAAANGGGAEVGAAGFYGSGSARRRSEPAGQAAPSQPVRANGRVAESAARGGGPASNGPVAQAQPPGSGSDQGRRPGAAAVGSGGRAGVASGGKCGGEPGAGSGARTSDPAAVRAFLQARHTGSLYVAYFKGLGVYEVWQLCSAP